MSAASAEAVAAAFVAACRAELDALKPGNVHLHAAGHGMEVDDFLRSAEVSARPIADPGLGIGARILAAVEATRSACGQNTNLGILLLSAPLAAAAQAGSELAGVLAGLTVEDASLAYRAIRLAAPGGLGRSERHDVADEPTITLLEAMRTAATRDRIARQYASAYADVLGLGVPRLRRCRARGWPEPWAMASTYLAFLAAFPDSHVVRKHGAAAAEKVRAAAIRLDEALLAADDPAALQDTLLEADRTLKAAGLNPGTSADLTVASHLAAGLGAARRSSRTDRDKPFAER